MGKVREVGAPREAARPNGHAAPGPAAVLVVDDDASVREMLAEVLARDERLSVAGEAADGSSAVDAAGRLQPDVIILDHQMPGLSGLDALPALRERAPHAVVVMLSGAPGADLERQAAEAGADAFFRKGSGMRAMLDAVLVLLAAAQNGADAPRGATAR